MSAETSQPEAVAGITSLSVYRRQLGVSKTTLWRYRRNGWLKCFNVLGKLAKEPHGCAALQAAA